MTLKLNLQGSTKFILATSLVAALFAVSYYSFASYRPKALKEMREVKGYSTGKSSLITPVIPPYAKNLGTDQFVDSRKVTFESDKTPADIKTFYINILDEDGWKLKKEDLGNGSYIAEYKKDDYEMDIQASFDSDKKVTLASVEISKD